MMDQTLLNQDAFSAIDIHFAGLMKRLSGGDDAVYIAAALVSSQARTGNICFDIEAFSGKEIGETTIRCPDKEDWVAALKQSPVVGSPGSVNPLILDADRWVYLYRYRDYQDSLAKLLRERILLKPQYDDGDRERLDRYFPDNGQGRDWQKIAAGMALMRSFSVISGGPGTGKTTTITRVLALIAESWVAKTPDQPLKVFLAAPTGKAAARLMASVAESKQRLNCDELIKEMIPDTATTIHRLLGTIPNSPYFRYNENKRLPADLVVVDEASMVDLALMTKLVYALPAECRLILLGDQYQLASVEAGAVLADICNTGVSATISHAFNQALTDLTGQSPGGDLSDNTEYAHTGDSIAVLNKSYRFDESSGIKHLSDAVNTGDWEQFFRVFDNRSYTDISYRPPGNVHEFEAVLEQFIRRHIRPVLEETDILKKLEKFEKSRILCAVRNGFFGIENLNTMVERILKKRGLIRYRADEGWYPGRPVMITRNDYRTGLFNGDTGITVQSDDGRLEVCFPAADNSIRRFRPHSLPACETVYAMTVHKSQGSEFDSVLFLIPERESPVLTRELVYTGITRAKRFVDIRGDKTILKKSIQKKIVRHTGLRNALWGSPVE